MPTVETVELCECGPIPGVITGADSDHGVMRCDTCQRFEGDLAAAEALAAAVGGVACVAESYASPRYALDPETGMETEADVDEDDLNPWVEVDGRRVGWEEVDRLVAARAA